MLSLLSILSMLTEFWQTLRNNKLTCYGSSEGSGIWSPVIVVIAQHIIHADGVLADITQKYTIINLLVTGCWRGVGCGVPKMLTLYSILSMVRGFWQTEHRNKLTCYGSPEESRLRSLINVTHAEGALAYSRQ
jgi:hypothetical protein